MQPICPQIRTNRSRGCASWRVFLKGSWSADSFRARGHMRRSTEAGHMEAPDRSCVDLLFRLAPKGGASTYASRGMGFSPGEESRSKAVAAQSIEAQPTFGQIKPGRGRVVRAPNSILGRRRGGRRGPSRLGIAFQDEERASLAHAK
jgi:hypothetical protein